VRLAAGLAVLALGIPAFAQKESALSYPGTAPDTAAASALAKDVIGRVNKAYRTLLDTDTQGFEAVYTLAIDGQAWGDVAVSWSREGGSTEAKFRPAPGRPADSEQTVREIEFFIANDIGENAGHLATPPGLRALRRGDWWIVDDIAPPADTRLSAGGSSPAPICPKRRFPWPMGTARAGTSNSKAAASGTATSWGPKSSVIPLPATSNKTDYGYSLQDGRLFVQSLRIGRTSPGTDKEISLAVDLQSVTFR